MKIGKYEFERGVFLAPMAGFSDRAMRVVSHSCGADYSVSEMVSAKAVCFSDRKTALLARLMSDEGPAAVQIFGSDPEIMARAAERLSFGIEGGCDPVAIDINMGCPVHKVFSNAEGSALMKNPDLIYKIVKAVNGNTGLPVTVKMRLGVDQNHKNVVECALAAESAGAAVIAVHGRTRAEMYSGAVDFEAIKNVKLNLQIPVIANGDIIDAKTALAAFNMTGADAIMIGRGAIGNPFLFSEIKAALKGEEYTPPTLCDRVDMALRQLCIAVEEKGEEIAVREARKQIALYLKGFRGAAALRAAINRAEFYKEVEKALKSVLLFEEI